MQKNILLIIESSETGGAENVFIELVRRIDRSSFRVHVALLYEGWLYDRLVELGEQPILVPTRRGAFDFSLFMGIRRLLKELRIDLVHSHLFTTNVYASVCGALAGVPVISTFHGTMDVASGDWAKRIKWFAVNRFSRCSVFVSKYLRDYFVELRLANGAKSRVVYNGIDIDRFRHGLSKPAARGALGLSAGNFIVGCVGDLCPAKDYPSALRAVSLLKERVPGLKLVIAGTKTGMLGELEVLSESLGLEQIVHFLGFRSAIENVLPAFDVYLSSSISEGFSLTIVEAMASGLPVVATRSGGPEEIIRHGDSGLLVEVGAPEAIALALETLYRDRDAAESFSRSGFRQAVANFSVQVMVNGYQSIYGEFGQRKGAGRL